MAQPPVRGNFKAPEGEYRLYSERVSRSGFSNSRASRLTLARVQGEQAGVQQDALFVVLNASDFLYISEYAQPDREPLRSMYCGTGGGGPLIWASCHAHAPSSDGVDLLVGLSSGDVLASSALGQIAAQRNDGRRAACLHFNIGGAHDPSRVTGVAWLGRGMLAASHLSGNIMLYQKKGPVAEAGKVATQFKSIVSVAGPDPLAKIVAGAAVNALVASPDGASIAAACADGVLRIYDVASRRLVGGFKSYYGGLLCCAWSPDGGYIATGGEDDLVCMYGVAERAVVAWGGGHQSWVSSLAFDPWQMEHEPEGLVRLLSGGQDGQLALWDFDLSPQALTPVSPRGGGTAAAAAGRAPMTARQLSVDSAVDGRTNGAAAADAAPGSSFVKGAASSPIAPSVPHADMDVQPPVKIRRLHNEPISAVLPTPGAVFLCNQSGSVRCWRRPPPSLTAAAVVQVRVEERGKTLEMKRLMAQEK